MRVIGTKRPMTRGRRFRLGEVKLPPETTHRRHLLLQPTMVQILITSHLSLARTSASGASVHMID